MHIKTTKLLLLAFLFSLPVVLVCGLDPAAGRSLKNFFGDFFGAIFLFDLPLAVCVLHYYFPHLFRSRDRKHYSLLPWVILALISQVVIAGGMFWETRFGQYPENGFSVVCAYALGWLYIYFTMIPIGLLYVIFLAVKSFFRTTSRPPR